MITNKEKYSKANVTYGYLLTCKNISNPLKIYLDPSVTKQFTVKNTKTTTNPQYFKREKKGGIACIKSRRKSFLRGKPLRIIDTYYSMTTRKENWSIISYEKQRKKDAG